jgi:hypothetical protein
MKKIFLLSFLFAGMISCNSNPVNSENNTAQQPAEAAADTTAKVTKTEYKTVTGKIITVSESHPQGQSLSNISVGFSGDPGSEIKYTDVDPINKVLIDDLNADGFSEIYIITISAGSGSYGNVIGLASNSDKSLSMITIPPVEENDMKKGGKFEGYEGHDEFMIIENSLSRTFPIKAANATKRAINYKMKAGEAGYLLYIKTSTAY